jgi:hypothetical protein
MEELYDLERRQQKNMQELESRKDNEKKDGESKRTPATIVPAPEIGVRRGDKVDRIKEGKELRARASSVARGEGVELTNTGQVRQKLAFGPGAKDVRKIEKPSKDPPGKKDPPSPVKKSARGDNQGGDERYEEKIHGDRNSDYNKGNLKLNSWVDKDDHKDEQSLNGVDKGRKKEGAVGIAMVSNDDMFRDNPGGGYLSEYRKKNKEKPPNRRHSSNDNDDDMSQNSAARSLPPLSSRRNEKHAADDNYSLPVIPPPNKRADSHRHPPDTSKQMKPEGTGRSGGIVSAPSRIRTGTQSDSNDFSAFESESVQSFLPPPVRLSHDYGQIQGGRGLLQK